MSTKQTIFLVSRLLCLWFAYNGIVNLATLPASYSIINAISSIQHNPDLGESYLSSLIGQLAILLLKGTADIVLAIIFYRCGPGVIGFFLKDASPAEIDSSISRDTEIIR